jgi:hypothetical protein
MGSSHCSSESRLSFFESSSTDPLERIVIDPNEDFDTVAERIGVGEDEQLRTSNRREKYLKSFAQITTHSDLELVLHSSRSETEHTDDGSLLVRIASNRRDQPTTDLSRKVFDLVCQEAVTIHEIGHVLYSDFDALNREITAIDNEYSWLLFQFINPLEDGAIEAQLRGRYNVDAELLTLYSNISPTITHGTNADDRSFDDYDGVMFTFHEATIQTLYDACTYDAGMSTRLIDPSDDEFHFVDPDDRSLFIDFLPQLRSHIAEVLSEPSGSDRMELIGDFFRQVYLDYLDDAAIAGVDQALNKQERGEQSGGRVGSDMDWSTIGDGVSASQETIEDADRLPTKSELEAQLGGGSDGDNDGDSDSNESGDDLASEGIGSVVGSIDDDVDDSGQSSDSEHDTDDLDPDGNDFEADLEDEYRDEIRQEAAQAADGMLDEAETMHSILGGHEDLSDLELVVERREEHDTERWRVVEQWGNRLATILQRRLRRERATKAKTRQRTGSIDTRRLMDATRGYSRIFTRKDQPDTNDHSCLIVQDRSTSMSHLIEPCENAVGSFAYALEQVDVDVSILDFVYGTPRLTLPFGTGVADRRAELLSGVIGGGTPLSDVVALGRHRLDMVSGSPFMIVVTDDAPASPERYQEQLDHCAFPVIGVSLCPGGDPGTVDHAEFFHRSKVVESMDELVFDLEHLAREVLI